MSHVFLFKNNACRYIVQMAGAYTLMLLVMLFDWPIFLAAIFGLGCGRLYGMRWVRRGGSLGAGGGGGGSSGSGGGWGEGGGLGLGSSSSIGSRLHAKQSDIFEHETGKDDAADPPDRSVDEDFTLGPAGGTPCCDGN